MLGPVCWPRCVLIYRDLWDPRSGSVTAEEQERGCIKQHEDGQDQAGPGRGESHVQSSRWQTDCRSALKQKETKHKKNPKNFGSLWHTTSATDTLQSRQCVSK